MQTLAQPIGFFFAYQLTEKLQFQENERFMRTEEQRSLFIIFL